VRRSDARTLLLLLGSGIKSTVTARVMCEGHIYIVHIVIPTGGDLGGTGAAPKI